VATRAAGHRDLARGSGAAYRRPHRRDAGGPDAAIVFAPAGEIVPLRRAVRKAGVESPGRDPHESDPAMDYEPYLFHEKTPFSVEANTRRDGEDPLREAAQWDPAVDGAAFLEAANDA
jgi:hypothetical protein